MKAGCSDEQCRTSASHNKDTSVTSTLSVGSTSSYDSPDATSSPEMPPSLQKQQCITDFHKLYAITNESTHAYSYNPLSPNSLTVRLNILKRTLELLINNPELMREPHDSGDDITVAKHARTLSVQRPPLHARHPTEVFSGNHRTAALNAFVNNASTTPESLGLPKRPAVSRRSVSSLSSVNVGMSDTDTDTLIGSLREPPHPFYKNTEASSSSELLQTQRLELTSLLRFLNETLEKNTSSKATHLHQLSLLNINKLFNSSAHDHNTTLQMKKALLNSLAEPFVEQQPEYHMNANLPIEDKIRNIINSFTAAKNSHSMAIFTCEQDYPWSFKSANDLTCLNFGVSKKTIKILTLLDLIHLDARDFVIGKLTDLDVRENDMVMTGEIVPTVSNGVLTWSSLWIKKKNDMLVCVFEKVPCDYMDLTVDYLAGFKIKKIAHSGNNNNLLISTSLPPEFDLNNVNNNEDCYIDLAHFSKSLGALIDDSIQQYEEEQSQVDDENDDGSVSTVDSEALASRISQEINATRYFTLNHLSSNIPCAISSALLNNNLKLKVHSLPYQSGLFILDRELDNDSPEGFQYRVVSFNKSISKNLFGYRYKELIDEPVTKIIPNFNKIVKYIIDNNANLNIQDNENEGLILTEHFFRKVQATMDDDPEGFYTSIGIDGQHKDGAMVKIDIQMRVINENIISLWLTHSRDVIFTDYNTIPSQLHIMEHEQEDNFNSLVKEISLGSTGEAEDVNEAESLPVQTTEDTSHMSTHPEELHSDEDDELQESVDIAKQTFVTDKSVFVKSKLSQLDESKMKVSTPQQEFPNLATIGANRRTTKFSDYTIIQKLGEGAYGKVHLCLHNKTKKPVIIKSIFKERILVDTWVRDRQLGTIPSEIDVMAKFNTEPHDNILKILGFFEDDMYYYIEIERHGGDQGCIDLFDLIEFKEDMTEREGKLIFRQIVSAVKHMHDYGIVHRDIKDENIIVDGNGIVKLIDFGSAAYAKSGPFDVFVGTIDYASPEVLRGNAYSGKPQDVWAIGILLYTIIFKENPFYNVDEILDGELKLDKERAISDDCKQLITSILDRNIATRPTINDIMQSRWLSDDSQ